MTAVRCSLSKEFFKFFLALLKVFDPFCYIEQGDIFLIRRLLQLSQEVKNLRAFLFIIGVFGFFKSFKELS